MAHHQPEFDDPFDDEAEDDVILQREWNRAENGIRKVSQWGEHCQSQLSTTDRG